MDWADSISHEHGKRGGLRGHWLLAELALLLFLHLLSSSVSQDLYNVSAPRSADCHVNPGV